MYKIETTSDCVYLHLNDTFIVSSTLSKISALFIIIGGKRVKYLKNVRNKQMPLFTFVRFRFLSSENRTLV